MNKQQYETWVLKADDALQQSNLFEDDARQKIKSSYNGYVAALGVSVLMTGLIPTLAIYYQDNEGVCRQKVLDVIARMLGLENSRKLLDKALHSSENERKALQKSVLESSIALKQVVRTYEFID